MSKSVLMTVLMVFVGSLAWAQERPVVNAPGEEETFSGGRPVYAKGKPSDDFGKTFEGYVQVDETWEDVRIVRSRTEAGKTPDVGVKFTGTPRVSVVERVEPMFVDWVQDDEEEWVFSPVIAVTWFERIVVQPSEKRIFAEKIENDRLFTYAAKEVIGAEYCLEYRCGALYRFDPKPVSCRWLAPKKGESENCFQ